MKLLDFARERAENHILNKRFQKALADLRKYEHMSEYETDAFRFVVQNAPYLNMRYEEAQNRLEHSEIRPVVFSWARETIKDGKEHKTRERIIKEIDRFDETAMLTPGEFFALSYVFIFECAKVFLNAFEKTLLIQKSMIEAERWMEKDSRIPASFDPVFFPEHALKLSSEKGDLKKRKETADCLQSLGKSESEIVKAACDSVSELLLRLTNTVSIIHTVIDMDWMEAYQKISHIEKTLSSDPAGIYPSMDEQSKSAVRCEIEKIHKITHTPQRRIASVALKLSETAQYGITEIIYTDSGRQKLLEAINAGSTRLPRMIPDPKGYKIILSNIGIFSILSVITACLLGPMYLLILFPCLFSLSEDIVRRISRRCGSTRPLLSLKFAADSEENRTLVVIPALLASVKSAESALSNLASYGAHENSENIDFLLLGDFKDSQKPEQDNDAEIMKASQKGIEALNSKCERKKYFYLIRNRTYNETDQIYMGYERKRGALMDLNRLLLGYGNRFGEESADAKLLVNRYKYVLTVDVDTKILPGTIQKMIGVMAHPLNRDYGVLQPRMENAGLFRRNLFSSWMAGFGGTDHYDVCASDFYQDMTGEGVFSGKGIYNIKTFYDRTSEAFQENTVLSHDMIEGILSKAGYLGNIQMYESFPETTGAYYKRLDRWTRGDWQLIHYLFGRVQLNALGRWKIIGNLFRSLKSISLLTGIILSVWADAFGLLMALTAFHFLPFLLNGLGALKMSIISFLLLPITAYTEGKAAITAIVRLYVTKQKRLEWVTAAESEKAGKTVNYPGIIASILILPGLFTAKMLLPAIVIGVLFATGKDFIDSFDRIFRKEDFQASDYTYLTELSKRMWRYFEKHVPLTGSGFPPDNVQIDPPIGEQARTSPTNIGMYLISSVGAREMGLIEENELTARIRQTLSSLKQLETWHGLPYNWYDIHTLKPAHPKYVSSVDAGNLMASYVVVRNYFMMTNSSLSDEFDELIRKMEIQKLYNPQRKLFRIGADVQNNRLSASHYDLFSSEARILSYTAMAEKGIPVSHWKHLARPFFYHRGKSALFSWSGTMFEYMMPNLLMSSACGSLMKSSMETAVDLQIKKAKDGIWGISEAGYAAFDQMLNYQYKAFGIKEMALSGEANESVYAPYAVLIALEYAFSKGMDALKAMQEAGLKGEYGFYEAIDVSNDQRSRIVYSYMSHHQGMGFIAIANLLTGNAIKKHFLHHPNEQALTPLLNEKPFLIPIRKRIFKKPSQEIFRKEEAFIQKDEYLRYATLEQPDGHILFSGNTLCYFESTGRSFLKKDDIYANLFSHDAGDHSSSLLPEIRDESGAAKIAKCRFDTSSAAYDYFSKNGKYKVVCTMSPERSELIIKVIAKNEAAKVTDLTVRHAFRISLNTQDMNYAHPVFSDLFVNSKRIEDIGFEHARKRRDTLEHSWYLYHLSDGECIGFCENKKTHGKYSVLTRKVTLAPGEKKEIFFSIGLEKKKRTSFDNLNSAYFERAQTLLMGQMNAHIQFCGLSASEYRSADRKTRNLFSLKAKEGRGALPKSVLWPMGLSGEGHILLVPLKSAGDLSYLKKVIRIHAFFRFSNLSATLVILKIKETEYFTPLKDAAMNCLLSGHLAENLGKEGGAMVLENDDLDETKRKALEAMNVLKDPISAFSMDQKASEKEAHETIPPFDKNALIGFNGYGGFLKDRNAYCINVSKESKPPRRWSNFLSNDHFGSIVNELGVSGVYYKNSRMGRITAFDNNLDDPKKSIEMEINYEGKKLSLFPGIRPKGYYAAVHDIGKSIYTVKTREIFAQTTVFVHPYQQILYVMAALENQKDSELSLSLNSKVDFLMGVDDRDKRFTSLSSDENRTFAYGCVNFTACAGFIGKDTYNGGMTTDVHLKPHEKQTISFCLLAAQSDDEAGSLFENADVVEALYSLNEYWEPRMNAVIVSTGNPLRDKLSNGFMKYQTIASRYFARFGPYQPGGAFGMRDQLQDLLSIMYFDKALAREHILLAASRQFERGDGLHWWHMPSSGVRTRISDDVLFLALITAKYVEETGDNEILTQKIPYLKNKEIPEGEMDLYATFEETDDTETLYAHIMKAFEYTFRKGAHGLLLIGSGDWNDGMNCVGIGGKGESVWLSMFWVYAANAFKCIAGDEDRRYLEKTSESLKEAIEKHAWDGKWYLRAYYDDGRKLGSSENRECRIDLIAQAWAVLSELDQERAVTAIKSVEEHLFNKETGIVRLLYPPFTGKDGNPGYISAYQAGTRENGGQYTHAVAWLVKAYAKLGEAEKAWKTFDMLLPTQRTDTFEKASKYGGEPYVISADISDRAGAAGECGWTWYTGAAAWATRVLYEDLLGLEIRGRKVKMKPLLTENMDEVRLTLRCGGSKHVLIGKKGAGNFDDFIEIEDDGKEHSHFFSARS